MENGILEVILYLEIVFMPNSESKRIFGEDFVKNNKEKCKLMYNGEEKELKEYYQEFDNKDLIKFKLKFNNNIVDMSYMFKECKNIKSIKFEGNTNEWQLLKIKPLSVTLEVFQFDIFGNDINDLHPKNIKLISLTLEVFQLDISGNDINELHPANI